MTIIVRKAQDEDIDFLVDMNCIVHNLHIAASPAYFKHHDSHAVADLFRSRLRQPGVRIWIADVRAASVGYAVSTVRERPENTICSAQRFFEIEEIGVSPGHRQKGVARALVEHVLADARTQGIRDVQLTSWHFNAEAHAAFEALGFRPMTLRFRRDSD